jgi:hypothetical protein
MPSDPNMISRLLNRIRAELKHHSAPENQPQIQITPAVDLKDRMALSGVFAIGVVMIPVAAAVPMLPIWPFATLCIVCAARMSRRFRVRLLASRAFLTIMSIIRTRPERMFRWADALMRRALGEAHHDAAAR